MKTVRTDERGRILLSKQVRKLMKIGIRDQFLVKPLGEEKLLLEKISSKRKDVKTHLFGKPIHVSPKKIKKLNLGKIEEDLWSH